MRGQKVINQIITDLTNAGFTVSVEVPGEAPLITVVKGRTFIKIDSSTGEVSGKIGSEEDAKRIRDAIWWAFRDVKIGSGEIKGRLFGDLRVSQ